MLYFADRDPARHLPYAAGIARLYEMPARHLPAHTLAGGGHPHQLENQQWPDQKCRFSPSSRPAKTMLPRHPPDSIPIRV